MATDPIIKDHQLWIGFVQPEGLVVSPHALKNAQAVLSHNVGRELSVGVRKSETVALGHPVMPVGDGFCGRVVGINSHQL
jgi:hypothetical protein